LTFRRFSFESVALVPCSIISGVRWTFSPWLERIVLFKGDTMVVPFARVVFEAGVGGQRPCVTATAES
jgi:hypothetical protein